MERWFSGRAYGEAAIQVMNIEKLDLQDKENSLSLPREFRVSFHVTDAQSTLMMRTEYLSTFSDSHFLLPEIFPNLNKVVVLDDDVVVQRDLTSLWGLSIGGKVNGAVQSCAVRLGRLRRLLGEKALDQNSCAWMSGLNVIDLSRWRDLKLSETYQRLVQQVKILFTLHCISLANIVNLVHFITSILVFLHSSHLLFSIALYTMYLITSLLTVISCLLLFVEFFPPKVVSLVCSNMSFTNSFSSIFWA